MPLTAAEIKAAQPSATSYQMADGRGLFLIVAPSGRKTWKVKFHFNGKATSTVAGHWPEMGLAAARAACEEIRTKSRANINPARNPRIPKHRFCDVGNEWLARRESTWSPRTFATTKDRLNRLIYPAIGQCDITKITPAEILDDVLRPIEATGAHELSHRVRAILSQVFRYAIAARMATIDPAAALRGALAPVKRSNLPHLQPVELPKLVAALDNYPGGLITRCAAWFLLLTFVRTKEMRFATWDEITGDLWRIPAARMKMRRPHLVPLSKQVLRLLDDLRNVNGDSVYIFANPRNPEKPISENAVLYGLYRCGLKGQTTGHGFRHTASTVLNETGRFSADAIERQLAHIPSGVRAVYNHAQYLEERAVMMQWWADYLDGLKK